MVSKIGAEAKNMAEYTISKADTSEAKPTGEQRPARRSWVALTIFAMSVFTLLSILALIGLIFGPADINALADHALPWSLLALALAGVAMAIAKRRPRAQADEA